MHIPSLESVYQAMVMQNNILNKQRAIMADIARRAQEQGRSTQIPLISSAVLARVREKEDSQLNKGYFLYLIFLHPLMNISSVLGWYLTIYGFTFHNMKCESIYCQIPTHSHDFLWPVVGFVFH